MSSEENSDDRPITVGVIDDDPMICQAMRLILEDYSTGRLNVVFTCTDGGQAVDEAGRHHPDVVLMDIAMPGMDGIEATRRLRALPQPPHVLILTSLSPSGTVERAVEAGAEGFVSKTDAPEDIIRRITDVCDGLPQFNPSSQRQLINDLNMQQPQSRRDEARAMLDALPEREREAVVLAADGYTNAEIAENECSFRNVPSRRTSHPRETDYAWAGYRWRVWLNVRICRTNYEAKDSTAVETPLRP